MQRSFGMLYLFQNPYTWLHQRALKIPESFTLLALITSMRLFCYFREVGTKAAREQHYPKHMPSIQAIWPVCSRMG